MPPPNPPPPPPPPYLAIVIVLFCALVTIGTFLAYWRFLRGKDRKLFKLRKKKPKGEIGETDVATIIMSKAAASAVLEDGDPDLELNPIALHKLTEKTRKLKEAEEKKKLEQKRKKRPQPRMLSQSRSRGFNSKEFRGGKAGLAVLQASAPVSLGFEKKEIRAEEEPVESGLDLRNKAAVLQNIDQAVDARNAAQKASSSEALARDNESRDEAVSWLDKMMKAASFEHYDVTVTTK